MERVAKDPSHEDGPGEEVAPAAKLWSNEGELVAERMMREIGGPFPEAWATELGRLSDDLAHEVELYLREKYGRELLREIDVARRRRHGETDVY